MSKYTITLNDGSQLDDLTMNGSMFVSKTEIDGSTTTETQLQNAVCDKILHWPEGWLFNLRQPTAEEMERKALETRLDEAETALFELAAMIGGGM